MREDTTSPRLLDEATPQWTDQATPPRSKILDEVTPSPPSESMDHATPPRSKIVDEASLSQWMD